MLYCTAIIALLVCEARLINRLLGLAVSKGGKSRIGKATDDRPALYDEYGSIPQVRNAYMAVSYARPIAAFCTENSTVVAFDRRPGALDSTLIMTTGCNPYHQLSSPYSTEGLRHSILLTGVAGDCRTVVRYAKQMVLNYTMEYGSQPSGDYVAEQVGGYIQSHLMSAGRMLACHCFVISAPKHSQGVPLISGVIDGGVAVTTIYEITAVGGVTKVSGGVAGGHHAHSARLVLRCGLAGGVRNSTQLMKAVMETATKLVDGAEGDGSTKSPQEGSPGFSYFELPERR
jgi:hypothetical protein